MSSALRACAWSVRLYVVCHTRAPANADGWNAIPFGRDTRVVQSNILLDGPTESGDLGIGTPVRCSSMRLLPNCNRRILVQ